MRELLAAAERVQWETKIDKILSLLGGGLGTLSSRPFSNPETVYFDVPMQIDAFRLSFFNTHARESWSQNETKAGSTLRQGQQRGATYRDAGESST